MKQARKPIKSIEFNLRPRGAMSWVIEHIRPSIHILPPKDDKIDEGVHSISDAWEFVHDRMEFRIGVGFKF